MPDLRQWLGLAKNPGRPQAKSIQVLAITQAVEDQEQLRRIGADLGWNVSIVGTLASAMECLQGQLQMQKEPFSLVVCDRDLPTDDWREVLNRIAALPQRVCVLLASRVMDQYLWDEVIQCHGYDVVSKPFQEQELRRIVTFALRDQGALQR